MTTLDEVEQKIRTLCGAMPTQGGHVDNNVVMACDVALTLVAHVRELGEVLSARADMHVERITALEARVADSVTDMGARYEEMGHAVTALEVKVAALEQRANTLEDNVVAFRAQQTALWGAAEAEAAANATNVTARALARANEREHLRAENERLRKEKHHLQSALDAARAENEELCAENERLRKEKHHLQNDIWAARAEISRMGSRHNEQLAEGRIVNTMLTDERDAARAENAELRKRVATLEDWQSPKHDRQWPDPQPIETAPMWGPILCRKQGFVKDMWHTEFCVPEDYDEKDVELWRAWLKKQGYTHWCEPPRLK